MIPDRHGRVFIAILGVDSGTSSKGSFVLVSRSPPPRTRERLTPKKTTVRILARTHANTSEKLFIYTHKNDRREKKNSFFLCVSLSLSLSISLSLSLSLHYNLAACRKLKHTFYGTCGIHGFFRGQYEPFAIRIPPYILKIPHCVA